MGDLYRCELHLNKVFTVWNIVCLNSNICSLPLKYKTKRPNFPWSFPMAFCLYRTSLYISLYITQCHILAPTFWVHLLPPDGSSLLHPFQPFSWSALCCLYHCIYCYIHLCGIEGSLRPGSLLGCVSILHSTWPALADENTISFCHLTEWQDGIWLGMIPGMTLLSLPPSQGPIESN